MKTKIKYTKDCTTIYDCYKIKDKDMKNVIANIIEERILSGKKANRTFESYLRELKSHKRLYLLGIKRDHTKDCDLEENITSDKEFIYKILGI